MTEEIWGKLGVQRFEPTLPSGGAQRSQARLTLRPKRTRLERYVDILRVVSQQGPLRRTHILYKANLSWSDLDGTLRTLEEAGTLRRVQSGRRVYYEITEQGRRFLEDFERTNKPLEVLGEASRHPPKAEQ